MFSEIKESFRQVYLEDARPWLVGFSDGNINSYYGNPHDATGRFDFDLVNLTFNVNAVDKKELKDSIGSTRRFPFRLPRTDNAVHQSPYTSCTQLLNYIHHAPSSVGN